MQVITPTDDEVKLWKQFSDTSIKNMVDKGMIDKTLIDEIDKLLIDFNK